MNMLRQSLPGQAMNAGRDYTRQRNMGLGDLLLEGRDLRPHDEVLALDDVAEHRLDLVADRGVLGLQVEEGDFDHGGGDSGHRQVPFEE